MCARACTREAESAADLLVRTVGLGCAHILLNHAPTISANQAKRLISLITSGRFSVQQKMDVLCQLAQRPILHELAGEFAQHVAEQIRQDDDIGQRGDSYVELAASLVFMSVDEAREYYRQGLAHWAKWAERATSRSTHCFILRERPARRLSKACAGTAANEPLPDHCEERAKKVRMDVARACRRSVHRLSGDSQAGALARPRGGEVCATDCRSLHAFWPRTEISTHAVLPFSSRSVKITAGGTGVPEMGSQTY